MAPRSKKVEEVEVVKEEVVVETAPEVDPNIALILQLQEKLKEMEKKLEAQPIVPQVVIQQDKGLSAKKVKLINLMNNELNISTDPDGRGRVFSFLKYGDSKTIGYDHLVNCFASYPYTFEHGLVYIADKEIVEDFGLTDEYEKIYTKDMIDRIMYLRDTSDVDLFLGMEENLQKSVSIKIAELINYNEKIDYNYIRRIKEESDIDLEEIANRLKLENAAVVVQFEKDKNK